MGIKPMSYLEKEYVYMLIDELTQYILCFALYKNGPYVQNIPQEAFPGQHTAMSDANVNLNSPTNRMNLIGGVKWDPNDVSEID